MLVLISPAKTLDFDTPSPTSVVTEPRFLEHSQELINGLRKLSPADVSGLMAISDKLGLLNFDRFQQWHRPFTPDNAKQALWAFQGDVYTGMRAETFTKKNVNFAQQHLRILSGLYGLLRPLDLIQPYRLEMGTAWPTARGKNLYQFWGDILTDALNQELAVQPKPVIVNLASQEYFQAVNKKRLKCGVITPIFKDFKNGQYKIISFFAKKARGMMSAYIIQNGLTDVQKIKGFDCDGYAFAPSLSTSTEWIFVRNNMDTV
jgi:cytoplasmic iron level regulating protein YaaA (DUF328/UPF0246 family)